LAALLFTVACAAATVDGGSRCEAGHEFGGGCEYSPVALLQTATKTSSAEQGAALSSARAARVGVHEAGHASALLLPSSASAGKVGAHEGGHASVSISPEPLDLRILADAIAPPSSAVRVALLFMILGALCTASLSAYTWSLGEVAEEDQPSSPVRAGSGRATDDSALDLATPSVAAERRTRSLLARRSTIVVAEIRKRHWTIEDASDSMSGFEFVVNMFADLCPPGMLPLAHGLKDTGFIPGLAMLVSFYALCVYTMYAVARTTEITGMKDYAGQWSSAIGQGSSWIPVAVVTLVCFGCNLSYSCFIADIFSGVMPAFGLVMSRSQCLFALTLFPILPLCLLKNLSALSKSSMFAVVAVIYTAVFMCCRAADGSYKEGGAFFADLSAELRPKPPADDHLWTIGPPSLALVNGLALAFIAHYNGCKYYRELEHHTPARLSQYTALAMGICAVLFGSTMYAGFHTFGTNADSVILQNYSERDSLANVARVGMGLSIVASFPLMFSGLREAVITLIKQTDPPHAADWDLVWKQDALSVVLLSVLTGVALVVQDAGIVVGLVGAICGSAVIYIVPCTLYASAIRSFLGEENGPKLLWLRLLTAFGIVLAIAGCYSALAY